MWLSGQNLDKPRRDKQGTRWHFRVWSTVGDAGHSTRVYFWNDARDFCGVKIFLRDDDSNVRKIHAFIDKLVASADLRAGYRRPLEFPLERHYDEFGAFPEEKSN
jgi:hypothetical protein